MTIKTILLIDDEPTIRELVQICLNDLVGWKVITAASAQAALQQLEIECPDAILLDVVMPGMDITTFLYRFHERHSAKLIPVILLSVLADWFTSQQLQQLGVVEAIAKPFNPLTLPDQITRALGWSVQPECESVV
ncbi:response regulator receiver domain protein [Nostoc sp. HK-01]|uniref:Response regulator receiver domain protein n=2 Tax=Nostocales TaxID=1161 RepID=A0A1Z4GAK5_9CYAN|nr:response regulator [Nostoc cycadae]BAY14555.1 response regulator receiver domain protein [Anabaenopsis circularis NIES-21]BBD61275.1 response regulator receiver domain protein [Nostoc sp. HK-01]GBE92243.1 two-component response regulator [Nostoc cycadae WK-1]